MQQNFHYKEFKLKDFSAPEPEKTFVPAHFPKIEEAASAEMIEPQPQTFSEEEIESARTIAFEEGRQQGRKEAEAALDTSSLQQQQVVTALLSDVLSRLDEEMSAAHAAREQQRKEVGTLVLLLAKKLAGNALTAQPLGAVEPMINDCLGMLTGETKLSIAVAPALVEPMQHYVASHRREGQALEVVADASLQIGDCRIQWPGGKAERNHEAIWRDIETIITRTMSPKPLDNQ